MAEQDDDQQDVEQDTPDTGTEEQPDKGTTAGEDTTDWRAEAKKWETRSKDNHAKLTQREQADAETRDKLARALGLKDDDDPADAAKNAAQERDAAREEAKATRVENAVLRAAGKAGADPDALTDSRAFMAALGKLDPADDGFNAAVTEAIAAAVKDNPRLSTRTAPASSGSEHTGPAASGQLTREDVQRMRAEGRNSEIVQAQKDGRLKTLLGH